MTATMPTSTDLSGNPAFDERAVEEYSSTPLVPAPTMTRAGVAVKTLVNPMVSLVWWCLTMLRLLAFRARNR